VADELPKLPIRAAIYLLPDGSVEFGALFAELLPVARALGSELKTGTGSEFPAPSKSDPVPEFRDRLGSSDPVPGLQDEAGR
jgi:hypothetical protein